MSATLRRSRESYRKISCWTACLSTLDVPLPGHPWALGPDPWPVEFCDHVRRFYRFTRVIPFGTRVTVGPFVAHHPVGTYLIAGHGHVMILVDGVLTDTDVAGLGRRQVRWADRLTPRIGVIE